MEFVQLTAAQRQEFDENGYLIVREALDDEMIRRLTETGERLMEAFEYHGYYAHRRDGLVQEPVFAALAHPRSPSRAAGSSFRSTSSASSRRSAAASV